MTARLAAIVVFGAIVKVPSKLGYAALAGLVAAESAGVPVPGETSLIAAALLAKSGNLQIEVVIAIAAAAAIVGDNIGYLVGARAGRELLTRPGRFERQRRDAFERGNEFFERHGAKAVFFGRWITGLRTWASWIAGMSNMHWTKFALWNAAGGIAWATTVGLGAYLLGAAFARLVERVGVGAAIAVGVTAVVVLVVWHRRRSRADD